MGKRKKSSRKPQGPKKNVPLPTSFTCLFCNHENAVSVKLDKKAGLGELSCKVCGQQFQTNINYLSGAVDVYSDWIDACDAVNKDTAEKDNGHGSSPVGPGTGRRESDADANTNAELGIVDDEEDAEADYEDY